jgi:hypothetical protein
MNYDKLKIKKKLQVNVYIYLNNKQLFSLTNKCISFYVLLCCQFPIISRANTVFSVFKGFEYFFCFPLFFFFVEENLFWVSIFLLDDCCNVFGRGMSILKVHL